MDEVRERDLLAGVIALQAELITTDQFAESCSLWSTRDRGSLLDILQDKGWVLPEDRASIEYLAKRRLARFGGDVRESLASCSREIRGALASIDRDANTVVQQTVAHNGESPIEFTGGAVGPRYRLNTLHAAGGIGEIWLARDAHLQRDVAVKRLQSRKSSSAAAKMRFLREARITGQLDHPGVVPIYEICLDETDGQPYYSMRFLKGGTLTDAVAKYHQLRKAGGADPAGFLRLLGAFCIVCNTVAYAHSKGIIHRDLKCDNVILGDFGEVVVIDWGLAKEVGSHETLEHDESHGTGENADNPAATMAGHILGTPAYMAPEQAAGDLHLIGPATDIYGLGAILYELLCGQAPFQGNSTLDVLRKVRRDDPIRPSELASGVPERLESICLKSLSKSQADRHPSAEHLANAVQTWISDLAERRQAEDERERFFALSLDLLAIIDDAGRLRQVSPAWERFLGYDRTRMTGVPLIDVIHPDDRSTMAERLVGAVGDQKTATFETKVLHRDQSYRWISWNTTPLAKEQCVYVVGRDITELKKSQQLFEGVMQSAPDAMVLIDPHGRIVMVNRQMESIFGYSQSEMLGQPVEILVPERFRDKHPANVAGFFAASAVRPMGAGLPLRGRRKNGEEFPADIALSPILTESGKLVAASVRVAANRN